ncbi:MAG: lytic transglycosylase domain-containing protein [Alphaproteobacteria bacterium]
MARPPLFKSLYDIAGTIGRRLVARKTNAAFIRVADTGRWWRGLTPAACVLFAALALPVAAHAASPSQFVPVMAAMEQGDWQAAHKAAQQSDAPLIRSLTRYLDYTSEDSAASFAQISGFLAEHKDWPRQLTLRRKAEWAMMAENITDRSTIRNWISRHGQPANADAVLHIAEALKSGSSRDRGLATRIIRKLYTSKLLTTGEQAEIAAEFGSSLRPEDHAARFEMLMGRSGYTLASNMLHHVPTRRRKPAQVALARARRAPKGPRQYEALSPTARKDRVIGHFLTRWHRRNDRTEQAIEALARTPVELQRGADWWRERRILARRKLAADQDQTAYQLAAGHGPLKGKLLAEAEALAGWIALNRLNQPAKALQHYASMFEAADRASLKSEAAYMVARSAQKLGQRDVARRWLNIAADYPLLWHGQQALARLDKPFTLPSSTKITAQERQRFAQLDHARVVRLLVAVGRPDLSAPFLSRMVDRSRNDAERRLIAELALMAGETTAAIRAERRANRGGGHVGPAGWPLYDLPGQVRNHVPDIALLHGLMRQESGFDMQIGSSAGARGLMQLMPGTARDTAKDLDLRYSRGRLTSDARYNMRLGAGYLRQMLDRYDGQPELALAAYNGGPGNVDKWLRAYGDPRDGDIRMAEWVELIPFNETRGYVQHVLENRQIYDKMLEVKGGS